MSHCSEQSHCNILITIPRYAVEGESNPYWTVFSDMILQLSENCELHILTHHSSRHRIRNWLKINNLKPKIPLGTVPDYMRLTLGKQWMVKGCR